MYKCSPLAADLRPFFCYLFIRYGGLTFVCLMCDGSAINLATAYRFFHERP
ncbi:hypothetical protein T492DRAFT_917335, partial [Pavlovales sp. CCMP2436]